MFNKFLFSSRVVKFFVGTVLRCRERNGQNHFGRNGRRPCAAFVRLRTVCFRLSSSVLSLLRIRTRAGPLTIPRIRRRYTILRTICNFACIMHTRGPTRLQAATDDRNRNKLHVLSTCDYVYIIITYNARAKRFNHPAPPDPTTVDACRVYTRRAGPYAL